MIIVSSLSGIMETINVVKHVRYLLHKELCKKSVWFVWLHTYFSSFRQELDLRIHPSSRVKGPRQSTCLHFPQPPLQSTEALKSVKNLVNSMEAQSHRTERFVSFLRAWNHTPKFNSSHYFLLRQSLWHWGVQNLPDGLLSSLLWLKQWEGGQVYF